MNRTMDRRSMISLLGASALAAVSAPGLLASDDGLIMRKIPSTGQTIPAIGLGSWITFNVGRDAAGLRASQNVIEAFLQAGGRMIDSSPMYGSSQSTIGQALAAIGRRDLFAADKVWTNGAGSGRDQIADSLRQWGVQRFSLLQVHNLRDWQAHLPTLMAMKAAGELDYIGITTSHGRRHGEVEAIMARHPIDFVQFTYNITHRSAESRLLPLARERGIAVIANRPFDGGRLVRAAKRHPFPEWASAEGLTGWPDFLLKFIVSHPAASCAIPATSKIAHVRENMKACKGRLPDASLRRRMAAHIADM